MRLERGVKHCHFAESMTYIHHHLGKHITPLVRCGYCEKQTYLFAKEIESWKIGQRNPLIFRCNQFQAEIGTAGEGNGQVKQEVEDSEYREQSRPRSSIYEEEDTEKTTLSCEGIDDPLRRTLWKVCNAPVLGVLPICEEEPPPVP